MSAALFDPQSNDGSFTSEEGDWLCVPGHVDIEFAKESLAACMTRDWICDVPKLDAMRGRHIHATKDPLPSTEEWCWFHTEPGAESEPFTLIESETPMRLAGTAQDSLRGAESNARADRLQAELWALNTELDGLRDVVWRDGNPLVEQVHDWVCYACGTDSQIRSGGSTHRDDCDWAAEDLRRETLLLNQAGHKSKAEQ